MTDEEPIRKPSNGHGGARENSGPKAGSRGRSEVYDVLAKAKAKEATHKAQLRELDYRQRNGELLLASDVEATWATHIMQARTALLGLPSKLAPEIAPISDAVQIAEIMRRQINLILRQLAGETEGDVAAE